jgi:hypothetical protein
MNAETELLDQNIGMDASKHLHGGLNPGLDF